MRDWGEGESKAGGTGEGRVENGVVGCGRKGGQKNGPTRCIFSLNIR